MLALLTAALFSFLPSGLSDWYSFVASGDWYSADSLAIQMSAGSPDSLGVRSAVLISDALLAGLWGEPDYRIFIQDTTTTLSATAMAVSAMMEGSTDEAMERLNDAIGMREDNTLAWYFMGKLNLRLGRPEDASDCFSEALMRDRDFQPAVLERARLERDRGEFSTALETFRELSLTRNALGDLASAEFILLANDMCVAEQSDSVSALLNPLQRGIWLQLAREQSAERPAIALEAAEMAASDPTPALAEVLNGLQHFEEARDICIQLLNYQSPDSTVLLPLLGISLAGLHQDEEAERLLSRALELDPDRGDVLVQLGLISERRGNTRSAVDYYLRALELDPYDSAARERLREIADDDYDPEIAAGETKGFSLSTAADFSVQRGSRDLLEWGGNLSASYRFDERGSSIDGSFGGRSVTWEESSYGDTDTLNTDRGWANLSCDYWFSDSYYVQAASSWDRQRYTQRPWQVTTYCAAGWQKWLLSWFWFSPKVGFGSVNAHWTNAREDIHTSDFSVFTAAGLIYRKPYTFIRRAELGGTLYFPPGDPENFISRGSVALSFRTWTPLTLSLEYSIDYTRSPEIESWKKFNTSFTTSLNLDLY